jgi:cation:H+ antiporter
MLTNVFLLAAALYLVIKGSTMATKHAGKLAESFGLSRYAVGFVIVAVVSILPETLIAVNSAIEGVPAFGFGMLLGSNVADLTLVFAIIILYSRRSLKVESGILKDQAFFPFLLLLPLVLGLDGRFSRLDGMALMIAGAGFYYMALRKGFRGTVPGAQGLNRYAGIALLIASMAVLLVGAHFTVSSATAIAAWIGIDPILIGMLVVGLGTTMPELFFALKSVKKKDDSLAIGDLLGTVLADATVVVGILALINPFSFPPRIIFVTGGFMIAAGFLLFYFMRSGRKITRKEGYLLALFWIAFVVVEFAVRG